MRSRVWLCAIVAVAVATTTLTLPMTVQASGYPGNKCVATKLKAASGNCKAVLGAWSKFVGGGSTDTGTRDAALTKAAGKMTSAWSKAEDSAAAKEVDCADMTLSDGDMQTLITAGVTTIVSDITTGLTLGNASNAKCGATMVKAAAAKCAALLKSESGYIAKLAAGKAKRDTANTKAGDKFASSISGALTGGCPTTATLPTLDAAVDALTGDVITSTTVSPNVPTAWTPITPPTQVTYGDLTLHPLCSRSTPYQYFVKRGTGADASKLLMYYQGGGACWDGVTCSTATGVFDDDVLPSDNPANTTTGFGDLTNPDNPFRNWSAVFVSYCTGDIHWGDHDQVFGGAPPYGGYAIKHRGYQNAKVAEKWAREHFVNPTEVFVTGSSAGAYGAVLHGIFLHDVYPASTMNVIGDAGNGVITQAFLQNNFEQAWSVQKNLPTYIPGLNADVTTLTIADLYGKAAAFYNARGSRFGQYTSAWDGGLGSQTFFYNVMVNSTLDALNWWHSSCDWNSQMKQNDVDAFTTAPSNYRYYIGPGSRHTIYGSNRVYTETHGPVQPFVDWVNDMRSGGTWNNVECADCSPLGACDGASPTPGASCQHDAECSPGVCTPIDTRPAPGVNLPNPFLADSFVSCPP